MADKWTLEVCRTNASGRIERESLRTFRSLRDLRRWMYEHIGAARTEWYHSTHVCRVIV